jgi:uncharacterized protein YbjT (DUF2867 family)
MRETLVVGATGQVGIAVVRRLLAERRPVRALVRSSAAAERFRALGADISFGDLTQPQTLQTACRGMDVIVATANAAVPTRQTDTFQSVDRDGYRNLITAAAESGVKRFVYASVPLTKAQPPFIRCKRDVEALLASSGPEPVVFRADIFMDVAFAMMGSDLPVRGAEGATVLRPYRFAADHFARIRNSIETRRVAFVPGSGQQRHAFICVDDVAAFMAAAVSGGPPGFHTIGGPEALSFLDIAGIYERILNCRLRVRRMPAWIFRAAASIMGPFSASAANLMWLNYIGATEETPIDSTPVASAFGVRRTTAEEFLRSKAARSLSAVSSSV